MFASKYQVNASSTPADSKLGVNLPSNKLI